MAKYPDLKNYLQVNHKDLMQKAIQDFVNKSYDGNGFHSINVLSLCKNEIENLEVKALTCHDDIGPRVKMDVGIAADIVQLGLGTKRYVADRKRRWFTVYLRGNLINGLTGVEVLDTKEFQNGTFEKENALDQFLVPYIYTASLEENSDDFTEFYCDGAEYDGYKLPIDHIFKEFDITCYLADLPENCFGRMYFRQATVTVYENAHDADALIPVEKIIEPGTMLISRTKYFLGNDGTRLLTIAHEIIHWHLHKKYFKLLALLDDETDMMSCEVEPSKYDESMSVAQKAHWFVEWQANSLAIRIAMPQKLMVKAFYEAKAITKPHKFTGDFIEEMLIRISEMFDVPKYAVKQRARQLDFDDADGCFIYVDGRHYEPFWFTEGILDLHQTFVINREGYEQLYRTDAEFAQLIDSGKFIYLGYVTCINDPKYITAGIYQGHTYLKLSDYAREHADECCLIYSWRNTSYLKDQYEFYGQAFLSKEVTAEHYVEHKFDRDFNHKSIQSAEQIAKAVAEYNSAMDTENRIRKAMIIQGCENFASSLKYHMSRKKIKVEDLAARSGLSDTTIKKYRSGEIPNPPIENVMAVCIGLNLHKPYCIDLLGTANYQLSNDDSRTRAYRFLLDYTDGTLEQWNEILDAFNQPHIPYQRNQKVSA